MAYHLPPCNSAKVENYHESENLGTFNICNQKRNQKKKIIVKGGQDPSIDLDPTGGVVAILFSGIFTYADLIFLLLIMIVTIIVTTSSLGPIQPSLLSCTSAIMTGAEAATYSFQNCSGSSGISAVPLTHTLTSNPLTVASPCTATGLVTLAVNTAVMTGTSINVTFTGITLSEGATVTLDLPSVATPLAMPLNFKLLRTVIRITSAVDPAALPSYTMFSITNGRKLSAGSRIEVSGTVMTLRGVPTGSSIVGITVNMVKIATGLLLKSSSLVYIANNTLEITQTLVASAAFMVTAAGSGTTNAITIADQSSISLDGRNALLIGNSSSSTIPTTVVYAVLFAAAVAITNGSAISVSDTEHYIMASAVNHISFASIYFSSLTTTVVDGVNSQLNLRRSALLVDSVDVTDVPASPTTVTITGLLFKAAITASGQSMIVVSNTSTHLRHVRNPGKITSINKIRTENAGAFVIANASQLLIVATAVSVFNLSTIPSTAAAVYSLELSDLVTAMANTRVENASTLLCAGSVYSVKGVEFVQFLHIRSFYLRGTIVIQGAGTIVQLTGLSMAVSASFFSGVQTSPIYITNTVALTLRISGNAQLVIGGAGVTDSITNASNSSSSNSPSSLLTSGGLLQVAPTFAADAVFTTITASGGFLAAQNINAPQWEVFLLLASPYPATVMVALPSTPEKAPLLPENFSPAVSTASSLLLQLITARRIVIHFSNVSIVGSLSVYLVNLKYTSLSVNTSALLVLSGVSINVTTANVTDTVTVRYIYANSGVPIAVALNQQSLWVSTENCLTIAGCTVGGGGGAGSSSRFLGPVAWLNRDYVAEISQPHFPPALVFIAADATSRFYSENTCAVGTTTASYSAVSLSASSSSFVSSVGVSSDSYTVSRASMSSSLTSRSKTDNVSSSSSLSAATSRPPIISSTPTVATAFSVSHPENLTPTKTVATPTTTTFTATCTITATKHKTLATQKGPLITTKVTTTTAQTTGQTIATVAAGTFIGTVSGPLATEGVLSLQLLAIFTAMPCPISGAGDSETMQKLLAPVTISGIGRAGKLIGNLVLTLGLACLYAAVYFTCSRLLGSRDRATELLRHPQAIPLLHALLLPGIAFDSARLIYGNDAPTAAERAGGAVALFACFASVALYLILARRARTQLGPLSLAVVPRGPSLVDSALPWPVTALLVPTHSWTRNGVFQTPRSFIGPMRLIVIPSRRWRCCWCCRRPPLPPAADTCSSVVDDKALRGDSPRAAPADRTSTTTTNTEQVQGALFIVNHPPKQTDASFIAPTQTVPVAFNTYDDHQPQVVATPPILQEVLATHGLLRVLLVCVVCAIRPRPASPQTDCAIIQSLAALICFCHALLVAGLGLYRLRAQTGLQAAQSAILGIVCSIYAAAISSSSATSSSSSSLRDSDGHSDGGLTSTLTMESATVIAVVGGATIALIACSLLQMAAVVAAFFIERHLRVFSPSVLLVDDSGNGEQLYCGESSTPANNANEKKKIDEHEVLLQGEGAAVRSNAKYVVDLVRQGCHVGSTKLNFFPDADDERAGSDYEKDRGNEKNDKKERNFDGMRDMDAVEELTSQDLHASNSNNIYNNNYRSNSTGGGDREHVVEGLTSEKYREDHSRPFVVCDGEKDVQQHTSVPHSHTSRLTRMDPAESAVIDRLGGPQFDNKDNVDVKMVHIDSVVEYSFS